MATHQSPTIFDRELYRLRRRRASTTIHNHDFLHRRAMEDVVERLEASTRTFKHGVFVGAGHHMKLLTPDCGIERAITMDLADQRLPANGWRLAADEEYSPLADQSVDLIVNILTLHHVNDLVGALIQMRMALKPDGLFIAVVFGEETLATFRHALLAAEQDITGGVSGRSTPFASVRDLGSALQRAGFALPVADLDRVRVSYQNPAKLLADLRGMGETSVLANRGKPLDRRVIGKALADLSTTGEDIQFDLITLTGWAPHKNQPKPKPRASATASLKEAVLRHASMPKKPHD